MFIHVVMSLHLSCFNYDAGSQRVRPPFKIIFVNDLVYMLQIFTNASNQEAPTTQLHKFLLI